MEKQELIDFENDIAARYDRAEIPYPIHLSRGNEDELIKIFKDFRKEDWCFSTWRNHYHALLAGIPKEEVLRQILAGRSMTVCSLEHRFFSSAIVAGCCPIALGVAWDIKRRGGSEKVWIFLGDMASMTGIAIETYNYAKGHGLPLILVKENNNKSVCTNTWETWGGRVLPYECVITKPDYHYEWDLSKHYPHSGAGRRIQF